MKVIMLTNSVAPDKLGGLERYVRELSARLVGRGLDVTVIAKRTSATQSEVEIGDDGVKIRRYRAPSKRDPLFAVKYAPRVRREVRRHLDSELAETREPVVVHSHFPTAALAIRSTGLRYVHTFHAPVYREILGERQGSYILPGMVEAVATWGMRQAESRVLRSASSLITLSQFTLGEAVALAPEVQHRHELIPGGIDTDVFRPGEDFRSDPGSPVIFTARRLVERTGVESLARAMPTILDALPDARLYIAGDGPRREAISDYLRRAELDDYVKLLGRISDEELVDWYRHADIAVTPTKELEGFGLATAEAMAAGTVPVVTPTSANPEVVRDLEPSLIATSCDPEGIARGVIEAWSNPRFKELEDSVRQYCHSRYSWEVVIERHISHYENLGW